MKKAILVASFGTTHSAALASIEESENLFRSTFPEYEVRRAFTSRTVVKRLEERTGQRFDNEREALERLAKEGYREVYVQPLHVVAGAEYEKLRRVIVELAHAPKKPFDKLRLGRPLLFYAGQEGRVDDYRIAIEALQEQLLKKHEKEAVLLMGHGGLHPANAAYGALQLKLEEAGLERVFVYTVEGFPSLESVLKKMRKLQIEKVTLQPLLLVSGDHVRNDMLGEKPDSAISILRQAGFQVEANEKALGDNEAIRRIYLQHVKDVIEQPTGHGPNRH